MSRVVLAMSGGVDSSVAAWLLKQQGHEVIGLFMRHGVEADRSAAAASGGPAGRRQGCCSAADAADARRVADRLGVPFYALNFQEDFDRIVEYFVDEYSAGRTGHHARLVPTDAPDRPALCRARDANKDQSYVLFGIDRRLLPRLLLPVGEHTKDEIRRIAGRLDLRVADKPDSQEICFVPGGDHAGLVRTLRAGADRSGEIVTTDGTVVGRHDGLERFTVGQRKGLGVAFGQRRFVVRLEPESRRVVIGTKEELARTELTAGGANWLVDEPAGPIRCQVKIRYRSRAMPATVQPLADNRFQVHFDEPRHGVAPGQAAVCYDGDRVLGGGWIE
jgi:tRNA-specific 2-thiouridylase